MNKTLGDKVFDFFNYLLLTLLTIACIYPVLYVVFASISDPIRLMAHKGPLLAPIGATLEGYGLVFKDKGIVQGYINTIFYVTAGTAVNMIFTSLGAFVLSRKNLLWKNYIMVMITITMFFGGGLIPFYLLVKDLGMYNKWTALVFPFAISTWNMIILRTGFQGIPESLEESAKIDGANDFSVFINIIIPASKATLAVVLLYYLVGHWNSWFPAMIFLRDRVKYPIQLVLREILISNDTKNMVEAKGADLDATNSYRELVKYCTIVIATLPIMCVYPFIQKHFVKGVMIGSIKG